MRISDWSSDVCSSDLDADPVRVNRVLTGAAAHRANCALDIGPRILERVGRPLLAEQAIAHDECRDAAIGKPAADIVAFGGGDEQPMAAAGHHAECGSGGGGAGRPESGGGGWGAGLSSRH